MLISFQLGWHKSSSLSGLRVRLLCPSQAMDAIFDQSQLKFGTAAPKEGIPGEEAPLHSVNPQSSWLSFHLPLEEQQPYLLSSWRWWVVESTTATPAGTWHRSCIISLDRMWMSVPPVDVSTSSLLSLSFPALLDNSPFICVPRIYCVG